MDRLSGNEPHPSAVDAAPQARPGVPRERPDVARGATDPERSPRRTPVSGTAIGTRGLSGALRRAAYRVPEHRPARWAVLLLADRVDVFEHRLARAWWLAPAALALVVGYVAVSHARRG
jgi:hypothetical protein